MKSLVLCVVNKIPGGDASLFVKAATMGFAKGSAVVFSGGVVGRVRTVHAFTAEVDLVTSPDFRIAAQFEGDPRPVIYRGVLQKGFGKPSGEVQDVPQIYWLAQANPLKLVTTSLGGTFPAGLTIGNVDWLEPGSTGIFQSGSVRLDPRLVHLQRCHSCSSGNRIPKPCILIHAACSFSGRMPCCCNSCSCSVRSFLLVGLSRPPWADDHLPGAVHETLRVLLLHLMHWLLGRCRFTPVLWSTDSVFLAIGAVTFFLRKRFRAEENHHPTLLAHTANLIILIVLALNFAVGASSLFDFWIQTMLCAGLSHLLLLAIAPWFFNLQRLLIEMFHLDNKPEDLPLL